MQRTEKEKAYSREQAKRWREQNPEAVQTIQMRYYARKIFDLTPDEIADLLKPKRTSNK